MNLLGSKGWCGTYCLKYLRIFDLQLLWRHLKVILKCWDSDPVKRPSTSDIHERLINMMRIEVEDPTEIVKSSNVGPVLVNH